MALTNGVIPTGALTALSVGGHLLATPARAFEEWRRQAATSGRTLTITSVADAYRALAIQERVFLQRYIPQATGGGIYGDVRWYSNVRYVRRHGAAAAVPGTSNHGRGLAVDIANAGPFGGPFHDWLLATGPALGWSNAEGRSVNEPWHWVHDGVTLASSSAGATAGLKPAPPIASAEIKTPPAPTPQEDPDMARLIQCNGSQAVVGPGTRFQLLHTTTETEALQSAGAVTGPVINYGVDTLVWRTLINVAKRAGNYYP